MSVDNPSPGAVVRRFLAAATLVFGVAGLLLKDPRSLAASGAFGTIWLGWDLLTSQIFGPLGDWFSRLWSGGIRGTRDTLDLMPTLDDTVRYLEHHLRPGVAQHVVVQSAMRLEEIYRTVKKDPQRAREVIDRARELFPGAPELKQYG